MFLFLFSDHYCGKFLVDVRLKRVEHLVGVGMGCVGLGRSNIKFMKLNWVRRGENGVLGKVFSIVESTEAMRVIWGYAAVPGIVEIIETDRY